MEVQATSTRLSGVLTNLKLAPGTAVRLRFTILALDGSTTNSAVVTAKAPAAGEGTTFATRVATAEDVAGWQYEVVAPAK
jgi:hypothetical protein